MPEGHTIHRLARELRPLVGCTARASSPQGRFRDGAAALDGEELRWVEAYGKHLLLGLGEHCLHVHLGLAGAMFRSEGEPRSGVRLRLVLGAPPQAWDLVAPTRCELLDPRQLDALRARLGPDPLRGDDPTPVFEAIARSSRTIGELLLDQSVLAGVGNVFRAEALHQCRVHPQRPGRAVPVEELRCLWSTLQRLMRRGVDEGRIVTVPGTEEGRYVYKQEHCGTCGAPVRSWRLGARTAYACETCQPAA